MFKDIFMGFFLFNATLCKAYYEMLLILKETHEFCDFSIFSLA